MKEVHFQYCIFFFPELSFFIFFILQNGIRGLMLDMYDFENDVWLCHSFNGACYNYTAFVSHSLSHPLSFLSTFLGSFCVLNSKTSWMRPKLQCLIHFLFFFEKFAGSHIIKKLQKQPNFEGCKRSLNYCTQILLLGPF
jgi:hypothetical protein